jgi:hypothetical protein
MAPSEPSEVPPAEGEDRGAGRVERLVRNWVDTSLERFGSIEHLRQLVGDAKLPKEALALLLGQLDETKNSLTRAVAKEMRDFLERTNLADELTRALTRLSFEIRTEVRFIPNDAPGAAPRPKIDTRVEMHRQSVPPAEGHTPSAPPENREQT